MEHTVQIAKKRSKLQRAVGMFAFYMLNGFQTFLLKSALIQSNLTSSFPLTAEAAKELNFQKGAFVVSFNVCQRGCAF